MPLCRIKYPMPHDKISKYANFEKPDRSSTFNSSFTELINILVPIYPWIFKTYIDCKCKVDTSLSCPSIMRFFECPYINISTDCIDILAREDNAIQYTIFYLKVHEGLNLYYVEDSFPDLTCAPNLCDELRIEEWSMIMRKSCEIIKAVKIIQRLCRNKFKW